MSRHPHFPLTCPNGQGLLLLTPGPGTLEAGIGDALQDLKAAGATAVITLMTRPEMVSNKLEDLENQCTSMALDWLHLPVEDEGAPQADFAEQWARVGEEVHRRLDHRESIAIHCKGGSGRTGILAAQILMERGLCMHEAIKQVKELRPNAFAHAVQMEYIEALAAKIDSNAARGDLS